MVRNVSGVRSLCAFEACYNVRGVVVGDGERARRRWSGVIEVGLGEVGRNLAQAPTRFELRVPYLSLHLPTLKFEFWIPPSDKSTIAADHLLPP